MDSFVADSHNLALHPETNGRTFSYSTGQPWTTVEEGLLQAIVQRAQLPKRTTRVHWTVVADHLSKAGQHLGLPLRSPSSCWRKASRMGLIASRPGSTTAATESFVVLPTVPPVPLGQASFAAPEVRAIIADAFEEIAKRLRGVA